jgi:hypothetical protein
MPVATEMSYRAWKSRIGNGRNRIRIQRSWTQMLHICIRNGKLTSLKFIPTIAERSRRQFVMYDAVMIHRRLIQGLLSGERRARRWATIRQGSESWNRWLEGH